jgi:hypothetical protein
VYCAVPATAGFFGRVRQITLTETGRFNSLLTVKPEVVGQDARCQPFLDFSEDAISQKKRVCV